MKMEDQPKMTIPKSKIVDSIQKEQILQCEICLEQYDTNKRVPLISCLGCFDIVCQQCLNQKFESCHKRNILNKCNKCPLELKAAQYKRCIPLIKLIQIYKYKIKVKQTQYIRAYEQLQKRHIHQTNQLQMLISTQKNKFQQLTKKNNKQVYKLKLNNSSQVQKLKLENSSQVQKLKLENSSQMQNLKLIMQMQLNQIQKLLIPQNQKLKIEVAKLKAKIVQSEKNNIANDCKRAKQAQLISNYSQNKFIKIKEVKKNPAQCPFCICSRADNYRHDNLYICRNCGKDWLS